MFLQIRLFSDIKDIKGDFGKLGPLTWWRCEDVGQQRPALIGADLLMSETPFNYCSVWFVFRNVCVCVCVQWGHFDWSSHLQKECLRVKTWGYLVVILEFFWNGFRERHPFSLRVLRKMVKCVCVKWKRRPVLSLRLSKPHSYCWNGTLVQRRQTYNKENTQLDFWQMRGCFQAVQQFIRRTGLTFS